MTLPRGWRWPAAMVAVLVITVAANGMLWYEANSDPAFAVVPDYYDKALHWDAHMAQDARNRTLGWRLAAELGAPVRAGRTLEVSLADSAGRLIEGATVRVAAVRVARSADEVRAVAAPRAGGGYSATLPDRGAGRWELRFDVTRGGDHFTATIVVDAAAARE
jgi:nitrogen fixation protein FixH